MRDMCFQLQFNNNKQRDRSLAYKDRIRYRRFANENKAQFWGYFESEDNYWIMFGRNVECQWYQWLCKKIFLLHN